MVYCAGSKTCGAGPDPGLTWLGLAAPSSVPAQIGHQGSFWREREASMETGAGAAGGVQSLAKGSSPPSVLEYFVKLLIVAKEGY